jgi:hypothetical protein
MPCQDSVGTNLLDTPEGTVFVAVVSDGAGSAVFAEIGSKTAVDTSLQLINNFFETGGTISLIDRDLIISWLHEIRLVISKLAEGANSTSREFACTWLAAVIGQESAVFAQIGDGAMVTSNEGDDDWAYIFWPQHGEYANTTNFVTSSNSVEALEFRTEVRPIDRFASFSDGIENLVLNHGTRSVHSPFFTTMLAPVEQLSNAGLDHSLSENLAHYLGSERVCERTDDDKSLVLASRTAPLSLSIEDARAS